MLRGTSKRQNLVVAATTDDAEQAWLCRQNLKIETGSWLSA
jgi:hypothetical protein